MSIALPSVGAACSPGGCQDWTTFAETGALADTTMAPDGATVYAAAWWYGANGRADFVTVAYDAADGATRWRATWDGPAGSTDYSRAIAVTPDGTKVLVAGTSQDRLAGWEDEYLAQDAALVAYDAATGALLWSATWGGALGREEMVYDLAVSADGTRAFVVGRTQVGTDQFRAHDALVLAYDVATGALQWSRTFAGTAGDQDAFLSAAADGTSVYAAGFAANAGAGRDFDVVAYDAGTGTLRWAQAYDGFGQQDSAASIAVAGSRVVATGVADVNAFATFAYDAATGSLAWVSLVATTYGSAGGYAIAASPDGSTVYATGAVNSVSGYQQMLTFGYDVATGAEQWRRQDAGMYSYPVAIAVTPAGVFVAGFLQDESWMSYARTVAYDGATGGVAWTGDVDGLWPYGIAASPDGTRVVTGGGSGRITLVAYGTGYAPVRHELGLDPAVQTSTVGVVGDATYALTLENRGTVAEEVALDVGGLSDGWTATLSRAGETTPVSTLTLAAGETVELTLRVTSPATTLSGTTEAIVTAVSADASATASTTTTKEPTHVRVPPPPAPLCFGGLLPQWVCDVFG